MKRALIILALFWAVSVSLSHGNAATTGHEGSIGGILVGLALCLPLYGAFRLMRTFSRWQRSLNRVGTRV